MLPVDICYEGLTPTHAVQALVREEVDALGRSRPDAGRCAVFIAARAGGNASAPAGAVTVRVKLSMGAQRVTAEARAPGVLDDARIPVREAFRALRENLGERAFASPLPWMSAV